MRDAKEIFRVVIAGGRKFSDYKLLCRSLDSVLREVVKTKEIRIVSGKAKGADSLGERYAKARGYKVEEYKANWRDLTAKPCIVRTNAHGKYNAAAGGIRNEEMAKNSDATVAFWDGISTGTKDMIKLTEKYNNLLKVVKY